MRIPTSQTDSLFDTRSSGVVCFGWALSDGFWLRLAGRWCPFDGIVLIYRGLAAALALGSLFISAPSRCAASETVLTVFAGGPGQRPDVLRKILDLYQRVHPGLVVHVNTGASTSEAQRQYLSTLLSAGDDTYDALLIDVVNPAEYAAAGWLEPLDAYLGADAAPTLDAYLPVEREITRAGGHIVGLPWVTDAQFLYYRSDLLAKYGLNVPETWSALAEEAKVIVEGEKDTSLYGLSIQGAPIEGTVCTFLLPYWSRGREFLDQDGHLALDRAVATDGLKLWRDLLDRGILRKDTAETKTGDTTNEFKAGNVAFAVNWGFAWGVSQFAPDSVVKGRVGIARMPSVTAGQHVSAVGGWLWAVSAFSRHKPEAVSLIRYLTSRPQLKVLDLETAQLPTRGDLYADPDLLARFPWLRDAYPIVLAAKRRPVTARYSELSDVVRVATSSVLGGSLSPEQGVDEIENGLRRVLR